MILHLVHDEKIINRTIDIFEEASPDDNLFVVFTRKKRTRFVERRDCVVLYSEFRRNDYSFSAVIIHYLNRRKIHFLHEHELVNVPLYWIIWGGDLYNKLLARKGFLLYPPTAVSGSVRFHVISALKGLLHPFIELFRCNSINYTISFIEKYVDYIVTDTTENDFDYLIRYYPQFKQKKWKDFFYYTIDALLSKELMNDSCKGDAILVVNSASKTNNHIYAFSHLKTLNVRNRKIIVPLNYSVKKKYLKEVVGSGKEMFDENFSPLLSFLPIAEYNNLLAGVSVAIFANWRQEAIGNILVLLFLGAKVFLSRNNPVFEWATFHGLVVFELENINQKEIDTLLCPESALLNRKILSALYNKQRLIELIRMF
jgi:hypothetical protein